MAGYALTVDALERIRAECMADDVEIDATRMRHWSEAEAERYFGSGGTIMPPSQLLRDVMGVLSLAGKESLAPLLGGETLRDWLARLRISRHELLRTLGGSAHKFGCDLGKPT